MPTQHPVPELPEIPDSVRRQLYQLAIEEKARDAERRRWALRLGWIFAILITGFLLGLAELLLRHG